MANLRRSRPALSPAKDDHAVSPLSVSEYVDLARFVLREALDPGGIYIPSTEAYHWLDALCDTAKKGTPWQATKKP
jgi:hypothetical protein